MLKSERKNGHHQTPTIASYERIPLSNPDSFQKSYLPGHQHLQCTSSKLLPHLYESSLQRSLPRQRCVARSVQLWQLPPLAYLTAIHSQISSRLHKYVSQQSITKPSLFVKKVVYSYIIAIFAWHVPSLELEDPGVETRWLEWADALRSTTQQGIFGTGPHSPSSRTCRWSTFCWRPRRKKCFGVELE